MAHRRNRNSFKQIAERFPRETHSFGKEDKGEPRATARAYETIRRATREHPRLTRHKQKPLETDRRNQTRHRQPFSGQNQSRRLPKARRGDGRKTGGCQRICGSYKEYGFRM